MLTGEEEGVFIGSIVDLPEGEKKRRDYKELLEVNEGSSPHVTVLDSLGEGTRRCT